MGAAQAQLFFPDVAKGKAATQRVFSIIDRQPEIDASSQEGAQPLAVKGDVELRDVTFAYPQRLGEHCCCALLQLAVAIGCRNCPTSFGLSGYPAQIACTDKRPNSLLLPMIFRGQGVPQLQPHGARGAHRGVGGRERQR